MELKVADLSRLPLVAAVTLLGAGLVASCAKDDFDEDASWISSARNVTMVTPDSASITISTTSDKSRFIVAWPLQPGAGGYEVKVNDITNGANVKALVDTVIDGVSFNFTRTDDVVYQLSLHALGNKELGNRDADNTTFLTFNTLIPRAIIPSGTDLYDFFYPEDESGNRSFILPDEVMKDTVLSYNLEEGGEFTMSNIVDFRGFDVTIAGDHVDPQNFTRPTLALGEEACFRTCGPLTLRNIIVDASKCANGFVELSKEPLESLLGARLKTDGTTHDYYSIQSAIILDSLDINNLLNRLMYDNNVKYCLEKGVISNCVISLSTDASIKDGALIQFKGGFINDMQVLNSTIWRNGGEDIKYFIQYNNSGRADRAGYDNDYVTINNNTFYKVCYEGQICNYSGFQGKAYSYFTMKSNIFVDCSSKAVARRFVGGNVGSANVDFLNNTYMYDGEFEDATNYDKTGTAIESDPQFASPEAGDFTVGGAEQKAKQTGAPRWLK